SAHNPVSNGPVITVSAGSTTRADIDLASTTAKVTGTVPVAGSPVANAYIDVNYNSQCTVADSDGSFTLLLPPGTYGAAVRNGPSQNALGVFYFAVTTAGQAINLGNVVTQPADDPSHATLQ